MTLDLNIVYKNIASGRATLIDVRELDEWNLGHIQGARHIPLSYIEEVSDFPHDVQDIVYIYCARGGRARYVVDTLKWGKMVQDKEIISLSWGFQELVAHGFIQAFGEDFV